MNRTITSSLRGWLLASALCAWSVLVQAQNLDASLQQFRKTLESRDVSKILILYLSTNINFRVASNPTFLSENYDRALVIQRKMNPESGSDLLRLLQKAKITPSEEDNDVRWGIILSNEEGKELGALYLDRGGNRGLVNGTQCNVGNEVQSFLVQNYGACLR